MPFRNDCFASIVLESVLKHVLSPEQTLKEAHRVLYPGGFLFVTSPVNHIDKHRHSFTSNYLCKIIENAGFRITKKMGLGFSLKRIDSVIRRRFSKFYTTIRSPVRFCSTIFLIAKVEKKMNA